MNDDGQIDEIFSRDGLEGELKWFINTHLRKVEDAIAGVGVITVELQLSKNITGAGKKLNELASGLSKLAVAKEKYANATYAAVHAEKYEDEHRASRKAPEPPPPPPAKTPEKKVEEKQAIVKQEKEVVQQQKQLAQEAPAEDMFAEATAQLNGYNKAIKETEKDVDRLKKKLAAHAGGTQLLSPDDLKAAETQLQRLEKELTDIIAKRDGLRKTLLGGTKAATSGAVPTSEKPAGTSDRPSRARKVKEEADAYALFTEEVNKAKRAYQNSSLLIGEEADETKRLKQRYDELYIAKKRLNENPKVARGASGGASGANPPGLPMDTTPLGPDEDSINSTIAKIRQVRAEMNNLKGSELGSEQGLTLAQQRIELEEQLQRLLARRGNQFANADGSMDPRRVEDYAKSLKDLEHSKRRADRTAKEYIIGLGAENELTQRAVAISQSYGRQIADINKVLSGRANGSSQTVKETDAWKDLTQAIGKARSEYLTAKDSFGKADPRTQDKLNELHALVAKRRELNQEMKGEDIPVTPKQQAKKVERTDANYYKELTKAVDAAWSKVARLVDEQGLMAPETRKAFVEYKALADQLLRLKNIKNFKVDLLGPKDAFTQIADDILDAHLNGEKLRSSLEEARREAQAIADSGGKFSGEYTLAIKKVEDLEKAYEGARVALRGQSEEFARLLALQGEYEGLSRKEKKSTTGRALEAQVKVKGAQLSGQVVEVDADTTKAVAMIDALRDRLRLLQEQQAATKDNREWNRLEGEIGGVQAEIVDLTDSLGRYLIEQEKVAKNGLFGNLKAQAKEAKKIWDDLVLARAKDPGSVSSEQVDRAYQDWQRLQNQIEQVVLTQKEAAKGANTPASGAKAQEVARLNKLLEDQRRKSKEAKEMMDAIAKSRPFGRTSEEFKKWAKAADEADARINILEGDLRKLSEASREQQAIDAQSGKAAEEYDRQHAALTKLNSLYQSLLASLEALEAEGKELAAKQVLGIADQQDLKRLLEIEQQVDELGGKLQKYERILSHGGRRNREYAQSFFSLTQVIRELPNAAIGMNTFVMALSNNIPMLVDDINELREANKRAAAAGEKTTPVWKSMISVIFSWNTILVIAMTLLIQFSDRIEAWIKSAIKWETQVDRMKKAFASMQYEIERSKDGMDRWLGMLDKLRELPNLKLQMDSENLPQIGKLRNEVKGLVADVDDFNRRDFKNPGKIQIADERLAQAQEFERKASLPFFNENKLPTKLRDEVLASGSAETVTKATEKQKIIIEQYLAALKGLKDASLDHQSVVLDSEIKKQELMNKTVQVIKEQQRILREEARINEQARAELAIQANEQILQDERSTLEQRLAAIDRVRAETVASARAQMIAVTSNPEANDDEKTEARRQFEIAENQARLKRAREYYTTRYDYMIKFETAQKEIAAAQLEFEAGIQDSISENYRFELSDRNKAAEAAFAARKKMAEDEFRLQLKTAGLSDTQVRLLNADPTFEPKKIRVTLEEVRAIQAVHNAKMQSLSVDHAERQIGIMTDELEKQKELHLEYLEELQLIYSVFNLESTRQYTQDFEALAQSLMKGEMLYSSYVHKKEALDIAYRQRERERMMSQIDEELSSKTMMNVEVDLMNVRKNLELLEKAGSATLDPVQKKQTGDRIGLEKKREQDLLALQKRKIELQQKYGDLTNEQMAEIITQEEKYHARVEQAWMDTFQAVTDMMNAFIDAGFARREEALNHEMDLLQRRSDKEREAIEQQVLNEEEKRRKIGEINVREASQMEQLERRKKKLARDRAVAEKASGIFSATINTAVAVTKAVSEFGWKGALIPLIIAMGAAQVAAIAATPIPKYALGTTDHPGGLAVLGDAWKRELVMEPGRKPWISEGRPGVYDLAPHTVVYPDADKALSDQSVLAQLTQDRALALSGQTPVVNVDMGTVEEGLRDVAKGVRRVVDAINKKPNPKYGGMTDRDILMLFGSNL